MNDDQKNPYVGPRTFLKEEGHLFFGRDREARDLLSLVASEQLVLFYAQSGAGKSSLINTRLIPGVARKNYEVFNIGRVSGDIPLGIEVDNLYVFNLMRSLIQRDISQDILARISLNKFITGLALDENGYFYNDVSPANKENTSRRRALIIDQFEELFSTHAEAWEKREDFFMQLAQAMENDPYLWVVLVMREDYIATLDPYAHLLPGGLRARYYMQRLSRASAIKAVKSPAEELRPYAKRVAESLVENLASIKVQRPDGKLVVQPGQYVEPVQLQVVCYGLWENLAPGGTQITEKDLREVGDVDQALERYYDNRVNTVAKEKNFSERLIREWFDKELITSNQTRNLVLQNNGELADNVIQTLQGDLVRAEMRAGQLWYELSHDRLIEPVRKNNAEWFEKNLNLFQRQAGLWEQQGRSEGLLLRGTELENAEQEAKTLALTKDEQDFLEACQNLRRREQREIRQRRTIFAALIVAVIFLLVAVYSAIQANTDRNNARSAQAAAQSNANAASTAQVLAQHAQTTAQASANEALAQRATAQVAANEALAGSLAAQADSSKNTNHALALLLGVEAYQHENNLLTRTTLFQLLQFSPYTRLFGFNGAVTSIAVSPDGKWIAISSSNQISVLDSKTHQIVVNIFEGLGSVNSLAFNNDGTLLAAGGCVPQGCQEPHGQITLWDMRDPQKPLLWGDMPNGHAAQIKSIAFSPDGKLLASGSYDRQIILWDVSEPDSVRPMGNPLQDQVQGGQVTSIAFSPDGKTLASASDNGSIHLWNVSTPETATLIGTAPSQHAAAIYSIAFSLRGEKFAAASDDQTVSLWDWNADSPSLQNPVKLEGHGGFVRSVAFNADGTGLASAGFDNIIILWNAQTGERIGPPLSAHSKSINTVVFGAAETQNILFSGSGDRTVILWDLSTHQPLSQPGNELLPPEGAGQTAKSGDLEATAEGHQIKLQDSSGTSKTLTDHTGTVNSLSFSPQQIEGKLLLASASDDQTVILWDVSNVSVADVFLKLEGFEGPVTSAFFSEDGKLITIENGHGTQWIIDPGAWKIRACEAANRNLTVSEWIQFFGGEEYRKTCENIR